LAYCSAQQRYSICGVFVAINVFMAAGLWLRPALLRIVFGLLVVQQVSSHGATAWHMWRAHHEVDVVSLAILLVLPVTWGVLWRTHSVRNSDAPKG